MNAIINPRTATLVLSMEERLAKCATPLSKVQLFAALANNKTATITINNIPCILSGVQREDGSGRSFILAVYGPDSKLYRSYVRTTD